MIDFNTIPSNVKVPLWWAEVRSGGTPFQNNLRIMLIGAMQQSGNATPELPYILTDQTVEDLFGRGSMLASMYRHARALSPLGEIWGIAADPGDDAVAATGQLTFTNPGSLTGRLAIHIGENICSVNVTKTDDASSLADKMRKAIHGNGFSHVDASATSNAHILDLTCKWDGSSGNNISVSKEFFGQGQGVRNLVTITPLAGGTGGGGIEACLAALGDDVFDILCCGFSGQPQLNDMGDFLDDDTGRWSPFQQLYGHAVFGWKANFATLVTLGDANNDKHITILGFAGSDSPEWNWGAELAAQMQLHYQAPPELSRPLQFLPLSGVKPANNTDAWFDKTERQTLYEHGIATVSVNAQREVLIDRDVTTYKTNVIGDQDDTFQDAVTLFQTMYFLRDMRQKIESTFPRAALTDSETGIEGFCSPGAMKDVVVHEYIRLESLGLVENSNLFADALVVERDANDATRLNMSLKPDLVNQCRIIAVAATIFLQLTDSSFNPSAT